MKTAPDDAKKVFWQKGTCSRTFCYLLDRAFGDERDDEERAADPLAGGILLRGHQCGMVWGAALAAGAEAARRHGPGQVATRAAVEAAAAIVESFAARTGSANCRDFTRADFHNPFSMLKYLLFRARACFDLAEDWAPEAIAAATAALDRSGPAKDKGAGGAGNCPSCAAEVALRMGASPHEAAMTAGLAGGVGLSGNGCGALAASIWLRALWWCRANPKKSAMSIPEAKAPLAPFLAATGGEMRCEAIVGRRFESLEDHGAFVSGGGCKAVMDAVVG